MPALLEPQTAQPFPADRFVTVPNVPVFVEHDTTARDGRKLHFGPAELAEVAERCNRRIEESADYAAVTLGHTPNPGDEHRSEPEVIGFAGPFTVGDYHGKAAIFADLHVYEEDAEKLRKFPRRSPELWLEDEYADMYLDPIALLGAEAPRLDMGILYSANRQGRVVEKYAAVGPSAGNCFVPAVTGPKKRYELESPPSETKTEPKTMLAPDDIKQIVDAIEALDWVQWVKTEMGNPGPAGDEPKPAPAPAPAPEKLAKDPDTPGVPVKPAPDLEPEKKEHYAKLQQELISGREQLAALRTELDAERGHRVNAERYAKLYELRQLHSFDLDAEIKRAKYGKMGNEQFADHCKLIEENYRPIPVGAPMLPAWTPGADAAAANQSAGAKEKYGRDLSDRALKLCERRAIAGKAADYNEVLEQLRRGEKVE